MYLCEYLRLCRISSSGTRKLNFGNARNNFLTPLFSKRYLNRETRQGICNDIFGTPTLLHTDVLIREFRTPLRNAKGAAAFGACSKKCDKSLMICVHDEMVTPQIKVPFLVSKKTCVSFTLSRGIPVLNRGQCARSTHHGDQLIT